MTCQQIDLPDLIRFGSVSNRVILLGKGPSAVHAKDYFDGSNFDAIIAINDAGRLMPDHHIEFTLVDGLDMASQCADHVDRIGCMVSPCDLTESGLDVTWARYPCYGRKDEAALRSYCERREVGYMTPAESGMLLCAAIGYREIWCFGHDGGKGQAAGVHTTLPDFDYDVRRKRVELAARHLEELYGTVTKFWPEGF